MSSNITPATIEAAIAAAPEGATLTLAGVFPVLPLKARKPNLNLDCTQAEFLTPVRTGDLGKPIDGLHIRGGLFRQGISFIEGRNVTITGARLVGDENRTHNGISLARIAGTAIKGCTFLDNLNGVALSEVTDFDVDGCDFERVRKDLVNISCCQRGRVGRNKSRDHRPLNAGLPNADHPDAVQMLNIKGKPATTDILIEENTFEIAHGQGITQTHKAAKEDPRFARITYRRNTIRSGLPYGLGVVAVDGAVLEDNTVETLPGSPYISRIIVSKDSTDVVFVGRNTHAAYANQPGQDWPATVKPDPRDAEIKRLTEALAAANGRLDAVRAALA